MKIESPNSINNYSKEERKEKHAMNKKKSIAVAIVLALVLLIGGLLAYFKDVDTKTNEFNIGGAVDITLTEPSWTALTDTDSDGMPDVADGIHPGTIVAKDPTVTNASTSVPAYVFVEVEVPAYDSDDDGTVDAPLFIQKDSTHAAGINTGWFQVGSATTDTTAGTMTYVYAYSNGTTMTSLAGSATTSTAVFSEVQLEPTLTSAQAATASLDDIVVTAYGIQTDGYTATTPAAIWTLLQGDL
jgi:predicted ribosomally synthesized peptide with SipW-like signal peptide